MRQLQLKLQNEGTINGLKNVVHNQEPLGADATDAAKMVNIYQINGQWLSKTQSLALNITIVIDFLFSCKARFLYYII